MPEFFYELQICMKLDLLYMHAAQVNQNINETIFSFPLSMIVSAFLFCVLPNYCFSALSLL